MQISVPLNQKQRQKIIQCCQRMNLIESRVEFKSLSIQYLQQSIKKLIFYCVNNYSKENQLLNQYLKKKIIQIQENRHRIENIKNNSLNQNVALLLTVLNQKASKKDYKSNNNDKQMIQKLQKDIKILEEKFKLLKTGANLYRLQQNLLKLMEIQSLESLQSQRKQIISEKIQIQQHLVQLSDLKGWQTTKDQLNAKISNFKQDIKENFKIIYDFIDHHKNKQKQIVLASRQSQQQQRKRQCIAYQNQIDILKFQMKEIEKASAQKFNDKINALEIENTQYKNEIFKIKKYENKNQNPAILTKYKQDELNSTKSLLKLEEYERQISHLRSIIKKQGNKNHIQNSSLMKIRQTQQLKQLLREEIKVLKQELASVNQKNLNFENDKKKYDSSIQKLNGQIKDLKKVNSQIQQNLLQNQTVIINLRKNQIILMANMITTRINQDRADKKVAPQIEQFIRLQKVNKKLTLRLQSMQQQQSLLRNSIIQHQQRQLQRLSQIQIKLDNPK